MCDDLGTNLKKNNNDNNNIITEIVGCGSSEESSRSSFEPCEFLTDNDINKTADRFQNAIPFPSYYTETTNAEEEEDNICTFTVKKSEIFSTSKKFNIHKNPLSSSLTVTVMLLIGEVCFTLAKNGAQCTLHYLDWCSLISLLKTEFNSGVIGGMPWPENMFKNRYPQINKPIMFFLTKSRSVSITFADYYNNSTNTWTGTKSRVFPLSRSDIISLNDNLTSIDNHVNTLKMYRPVFMLIVIATAKMLMAKCGDMMTMMSNVTDIENKLLYMLAYEPHALVNEIVNHCNVIMQTASLTYHNIKSKVNQVMKKDKTLDITKFIPYCMNAYRQQIIKYYWIQTHRYCLLCWNPFCTNQNCAPDY